MKITNPINWTAKRSRFAAPTAVVAVAAAGNFELAMGGVRLQDAAVATYLGSHTWRPPIM
jgi:hypothetical protein